MEDSKNHTHQLVDHLFRHQSGKMVAVLSRFLGLENLQMAEDLVQDAFMKALLSWKINGLPDNPEAWLLQVAKNKAIDELRKHKLAGRYAKMAIAEISELAESFFLEKEMADSQLQMIFACCHPDLKQEDQVALTLKIVSGLSLLEIARALMTNEAVIQKRIIRAKNFLRTNQVALDIPTGNELTNRTATVCAILYLLFNEGYSSSKKEEFIRRELCAEAMRCIKLITEHPATAAPMAFSLLSLMCFHAARFESRVSVNNDIILLREQDRSQWDKELINIGVAYLTKSATGEIVHAYQIEAAIAAEHALSPNFENTNWENILSLYEILEKIKPSPVILLNKAIVFAELGKVELGIQTILSIHNIDQLIRLQHIYSAVLADLYSRLSNDIKAKEYFEKAYSLTGSLAEKKLLQNRLDQILKQ